MIIINERTNDIYIEKLKLNGQFVVGCWFARLLDTRRDETEKNTPENRV